jgi:hypothetical protein
MASFAKLVDGVVEQVILVLDDVVGDYPNSESIGREFIASLGLEGLWIQTSDDGTFRKQLAGPEYTYDAIRDEFVKPRRYDSWFLDENNDWQPPVPKPNDAFYDWNEEIVDWVKIAELDVEIPEDFVD